MYWVADCRHRRLGKPLLLIVLACLIIFSTAEILSNQNQSAIVKATVPKTKHPNKGSTLDNRVKMLSKGLGLNIKQEAELKKVLEWQRDQIKALWHNTSIPAEYRISMTRSIGDKTADQIRALLNNEQRKKYLAPKPQEILEQKPVKRSVEEWMNATTPKK